jgi:hypothetical protein
MGALDGYNIKAIVKGTAITGQTLPFPIIAYPAIGIQFNRILTN